MSYTPPFTITAEILNLVADISQQVGRLDADVLNASPQLRKQNRNQIPRGKPSRLTLDFLVLLESGVLIGIIFYFSPQGAGNKTPRD